VISGYAHQRQGHEAVVCFEQMQEEGISPDKVTFLSVLSACSHSGRVDGPQAIFKSMMRKYGIIPNLDHHNCMVVAFGYAGDFDNAISVIKGLPSLDHPEVWLALLGACKQWGNVKLGKLAFDQAVQLEYSHSAAYALMAHILEAAGMQEDAKKVEAMRL
jgi:pentatricopeptide repeat protein